MTLTADEISVMMIVIDCSLRKEHALNVVKIKYPHMYDDVVNGWDDLYSKYLVCSKHDLIYK
jgi:hypothetical protein